MRIIDINKINEEFTSVFAILRFEYEKRKFMFSLFILISALMVISLSVLPYFIFSDYVFPSTLIYYLQEGFTYFYYLIIFAVCFFFSAIICEEYDYKTGYLTFPVINRYKFIFAKFLCNFFMVICVISVFYLTLGIAGSIFYAETIPIEYSLSFMFAILFVFSIGGFVTLISSMMKNVGITLIVSLLFLLIGESLIKLLIGSEIEPIYSLNYISSLIFYILDYPNPRYEEYTRGPFNRIEWKTPAIGMGLFVIFIYLIVSFYLAIKIFKKRQLK